jgi:hypothetical protein
MELVENIKELGNELSNNLNISNEQNIFLKSNIGQIANMAINMGIKAVMPDFIENDVIEVKDALMKGGIKEGLNKAVENAINLGKNVLGINNGFNSIGQAQNALERGELIGGISKSLDVVLEGLTESNIISKNISNLIKSGKNIILNNIDANVENEFEKEIKSLNKIEKYINNWEKYYKEKNMEGITKEYNKIQKQIKNVMPLENILKNVNKIENINQLIKKNDKFDFSKYYLDLAETL